MADALLTASPGMVKPEHGKRQIGFFPLKYRSPIVTFSVSVSFITSYINAVAPGKLYIHTPV